MFLKNYPACNEFNLIQTRVIRRLFFLHNVRDGLDRGAYFQLKVENTKTARSESRCFLEEIWKQFPQKGVCLKGSLNVDLYSLLIFCVPETPRWVLWQTL